MGREEAIEPVDALVEALDEDVELIRLGGGAGLIDLDPLRAEVDQRFEVRPDHVSREVVREASARRELLVPPVSSADASRLRPVVLVVRPDGDRVRARHRDLQVVIRDRLKELELVVVVRLAQRRLVRDRGLRVVLVVEAPHRAAGGKSVRMVDRPGVHLGALLLAVVDDLDAGALEQPERIAARPAAELGLVGIATLQGLDQLFVTVDTDLLAPGTGVLDVTVAERRPGRGLDQPGRLGERADLVRQKLLQAAASTVAVFAAPSRPSFSCAIRSETNWRSPFGTSATCSTSRSWCRRSANSASSRGSSSAELRASTMPASSSLPKPLGTSSRCVA